MTKFENKKDRKLYNDGFRDGHIAAQESKDKAHNEELREIVEEIEERVKRYRCGKHWLLLRLLNTVIKKKYD